MIGVEFASFFSAVGVKVSVVEMVDEIIPLMDGEFSKTLRKSMGKVDFHLKAKVTKIDAKKVYFEKDGSRNSPGCRPCSDGRGTETRYHGAG